MCFMICSYLAERMLILLGLANIMPTPSKLQAEHANHSRGSAGTGTGGGVGATGMGVGEEFSVPSPNCPSPLSPQHETLSPAASAHAESAPPTAMAPSEL